jgi:hypothetical protein
MKLPVIKHFQKNNDAQKLEHTIEVLESLSEHRSVTDEEMDLIGEIITNIAGAIEMDKMVKEGMSEKDAGNTFAKRVLGSIDQ